MKELKLAALVLAVCLIGIALEQGCYFNLDKQLTSWAASRGEKVEEMEYRIIHTGPYWSKKGYRYVYVRTDKNTYWVQDGMFGRTINQEIGDGKYVEIE